MVGVAQCGFPIRLEGLVLSHAKFSSYEPELFPGLIYRLQVPKLVLLIFVRSVLPRGIYNGYQARLLLSSSCATLTTLSLSSPLLVQRESRDDWGEIQGGFAKCIR